MALVETLILAIVALSASILFIKNRMTIILMYAALSTMAVVVFSIYSAPDVALAEASIGLVFTVFLYMVVLQHKGKLWVAFVKVSDSIDELEIELLSSYCESHELELKIVESNLEEAVKMLERGRVEIVAGALVNMKNSLDTRMTDGFLETKILYFGERESSKFLGGFTSFSKASKAFKKGEISGFYVDLFRYLHSALKNHTDLVPEYEERNIFYSFATIDDEPELLRSFNMYLSDIKKEGKLKKIVERHVR